MAIRADSFSTVDEVRGFTRHLLDGAYTFDSTSRPTITEVEKFIDRASALINLAISSNAELVSAGVEPSDVYANAVAKLACDDWVTQQAVKYVHYTQRNTGIFSDKDETFQMDSAVEFVASFALGFISLIATDDRKLSDGLAFTGLTVQADRTDPDDTSREQPLFTRRNFDNT